MNLASKIMKLETSLTIDDFHPETGTILIMSENGVESIEKWEHKTVSQPSKSAIDGVKDSTITDEQNIAALRAERNVKLAETDWVVTMHKELGTNIPTAWKTYRQALRDITDDATSLDDVTWPEKP
jgi:hypoxanthine phosphoribosyltransferase